MIMILLIINCLNLGISCSESCVHGVTVVDDKLCVLRSQLLQVFDDFETTKYTTTYTITVTAVGVHYRNDITSCSQNRCLYISDYLKTRIYKLSVVNGKYFDVVAKWEMPFKPSGISTTGEGNLLITCVNDRKLLEITSSGKLLRKIALEGVVELPLHAVEIAEGQLAVCHIGDGIWEFDTRNRDEAQGSKHDSPTAETSFALNVTAMSNIKTQRAEHADCTTFDCIPTVAHLVKSYAGRSGFPTEKQLAWPGHMALDADGSIYVADLYNDRIIVLNPDFESARVLSSDVDGLHRPRRLYLDVKERKLYVGQLTGEVMCIEIKDDGAEKPIEIQKTATRSTFSLV